MLSGAKQALTEVMHTHMWGSPTMATSKRLVILIYPTTQWFQIILQQAFSSVY
jgi:hypothetical protein